MPLRYTHFGLTEQKNYRLCREESEDSLHILRCPLLVCKRYCKNFAAICLLDRISKREEDEQSYKYDARLN